MISEHTILTQTLDATIQHREVRAVAEAVWAELGLGKGERARRRAVEDRILAAYQRGKKQPLYLVDAGLSA
jgi:hypothetical protein